MHIFRRYPHWWWTLGLFALVGILLYRFEWAVREIGIPLEWTFGVQKVSLKHITVSLLLMVASILASLWVSLRLEARLLSLHTFDTNLRVMLAKVVRAILVLISVLICGSALGIDLTVFSVFGGALGVGLGLALQRIASNYIAGYIILIERSLHIGHMVRVDKYYGRLTRLTNRYAVLDALDGTEVLLPNELLITQPVINYAYTEQATSLAVTVIMAHDIDVDAALDVLRETGLSHARVLKTMHPPSAWIKKINELGIELELSVWITDPEEGVAGLKTDLYKALCAAFREKGWQFARGIKQ